ncbi:MAG: hypothetical protein C5B51_12110 [Terriglobia bacterium]|nr:MAG: hypothetical protein C5B51_12110 [Terriglobia bacterium]
MRQLAPLAIAFLLNASAHAATLGKAMVTSQEVSDGCPVPSSVSNFSPADAKAVVWFELDDVAVGDTPSVQWYEPGGKLYQTAAWDPLSDSGNYCFSTVLNIAGKSAASLLGKWMVKGYWNGSPAFTLSFQIGSGGNNGSTDGSGGAANDGAGDTPSRGKLSFTGLSAATFNPAKIHAAAQLQGASFGGASQVSVLVNGAALPVSLSPQTVTFDAALNEGQNSFVFIAADSAGNTLFADLTLWSGARMLRVRVLDETGQPANDASVTVSLGDDRSVVAAAKTDKGIVTFTNLPDRTVFLQATANGNRYASLAVTGSAGSVEYRLKAFAAPSPIDNNDFSKGLAGWNIGSAPAHLVPHQEGEGGVNDTALMAQLSRRAITAAAAVRATAATGGSDLELRTSGEGPQSISRTFNAAPGTKLVTVRFKFITSEVPGGYFGSRYNDYFNVALRSKSGGTLTADSNSMNSLGLSAFTPDGATVWHVLTLPVLGGDTVQLDATVTNVGDGLYDSRLLFHYISETSLAVTKIDLREPKYEDDDYIFDQTPLRFLSMAQHNYLGGDTLVDGYVTVSGDAGDQMTDLKLEVLDGSTIIATSDLQPEAFQFLSRPLGPDRLVTFGPALFRLSSDQFANLAKDSNKEFTLRVRATSAKGQDVTGVYGKVKQLALYTAGNRYPSRDPGDCTGLPKSYRCGGDDWALPEIARFLEQYEGVSWNDFSNMNAGPFPRHLSHDVGVDADGWFDGYQARDAAAAKKLIDMVNRGKEKSVRMVFVTFTPEFQNAIKNVTLADGRKAAEVFLNVPQHDGHFHFRIAEHPSMGVPVTLHIQNTLLYPVKITVDGQVIGNVAAQSTVDQPYSAGRQLKLSFELVQPRIGSQMLGDPVSGYFDSISNPSGTLNFKITNHIGDSWFFVPAIDNRTDTTLLLSVNEGLAAQNRCNCTIPANSSSVAAGYYLWYSNSNVALFNAANGYNGKYVVFGTNPSTRTGSFQSSVQPETGLLRLTVITPP